MNPPLPRPTSSTPSDLFGSATNFLIAANKLSALADQGEYRLLLPLNVLGAISLEMFLKCLLSIESSHYKNIHRLDKLFLSLSEKSQNKIRLLFEPHIAEIRFQTGLAFADQGISAPEVTFDYMLTKSSDAFVKLRYAFEGRLTNGEGFTAGRMIDGVRSVILEHHPEWS
jgi:hypothetical protein